MKRLILCVLMCITFAAQFGQAQDVEAKWVKGWHPSVVYKFVDIPVNGDPIKIIEGTEDFGFGTYYVWSTRPFFQGVWGGGSAGIEIDGGITVTKLNIGLAALLVNNFMVGVNYSVYDQALPTGEYKFQGFNSGTLRLFLAIEGWSAVKAMVGK